METFREVLNREIRATRDAGPFVDRGVPSFETLRQAVEPGPLFAAPTCFAALGVSAAATLEEVKRAFRKRALHAHPDAPEGSHEKFLALKSAFDECARFRR